MDLGAPLTLPCGATLPNRVAKAAMSEQLADRGGRPLPSLTSLYKRWAHSGAGLLITGNVAIDAAHLIEPYNVVASETLVPNALRQWAADARSGGAQVWMQLNHPGSLALRAVTRRSLSPSAVRPHDRMLRRALAPPVEMTEDDIDTTIASFAAAAVAAEQAGFDGVEVHAAHGYLLSQFLSPLTNRRTDGWGGTLAGRYRIVVEVVRAIRRRVGSAFAVTVKLNASDFEAGGLTQDQAARVAAALAREGIDLLEVSGGSAMHWLNLLADGAIPSGGYFTDCVDCIRRAVDVPLMLTGGLRDADVIRALVRRGAVDMVGLARPFAVQPDVARRLLNGDTFPPLAAPRRSRVRAVGAALSSPWHQQQLRRLSAGLDPDPHRSRLRAAARFFETQFRWRLGREPAQWPANRL
jgi:2,4-dienoyl-CoA reductase-like NADH-dependent reductase (Old Yellow Enzyme family)